MVRSLLSAALMAVSLFVLLSGCGGSADDVELAVTVIGPTAPTPVVSGRVTSQPAGIDCGNTCVARFAHDTVVTLTATAPAGLRFSAWSGACSGATSTCTVTMGRSRAVTATFLPNTAFALAVAVTGGGTVSSQPAGIQCGSTCSANYGAGTAVTLTAVPTAGQVFAAWGGACSGGTTSCTVTLSAAMSVAAGFVAAPPASSWSDPVFVSAAGAASARVVIDAAGNATAVWLQLESSGVFRRSVWTSRRGPASAWSAPARLEDSENDISEAEIAIDPASGRAMAIWWELAGTVYEVWARPANASGMWGTAARIDSQGRNTAGVRIGVDANGNATAIWNQTDATNRNSVWSNRYGSASGWGTATRVIDAAAQDLRPQLSVSSNGDAFVVWERLGSGVWASRAAAGGAWGTPTQLAQGLIGTNVAAPRVVAVASGNAVAVWTQGATQSGRLVTNLVAKRFAGGSWSGSAANVSEPVASNLLSEVRLSVNEQGSVAAAWGPADNAALVNLMSAGGTWGAAAIVRPASGGVLRSVPDIGIDTAGDMLVTWSAANAASGVTEVSINRFVHGRGWTGPGVHQASGGGGDPRIAMNARANAAMAWIHSGNGGSQVVSRYFTSGR